MVSSRSAVGANAATPTTWPPIRATTPLPVSSYSTAAERAGTAAGVHRTPPATRSAAARECSVALHFSGCGPSSRSSRSGSSAGVRDHVLGGGEPPRGLVDQVVSGAGFDAHLVPACTTHELSDRPRGPVVGRADHQLVGDLPEVGEDLQAQDVQARVAAAGGQQRQARRGARSGRHARGRTCGHCDGSVLRDRCGCISGMSTNPHRSGGSNGRMDAVPAAFARGASCGLPAPAARARADIDGPIAIGHGQTSSQPRTVEAMLRLLEVRPGQRVLDVGAGSGWTTALLAHLTGPGGRVTGVELVPELARWGAANLGRTAYPWARAPRGRARRARATQPGRRTTACWSRPTRRTLPEELVGPARPGGPARGAGRRDDDPGRRGTARSCG